MIVWLVVLMLPPLALSALSLSPSSGGPSLVPRAVLELGGRVVSVGSGADRRGDYFAAFCADGRCHLVYARHGEQKREVVSVPMPAQGFGRAQIGFGDADNDGLADLYVTRLPSDFEPMPVTKRPLLLNAIALQRRDGFRLAGLGMHLPLRTGTGPLIVHAGARAFETNSYCRRRIETQLRDTETGRIRHLLSGEVVCTVDFEGDSYSEIVTYDIDEGGRMLARLYGMVGAKYRVLWQGQVAGRYRNGRTMLPVAADLDGDAVPELMIGEPGLGRVRVYGYLPPNA